MHNDKRAWGYYIRKIRKDRGLSSTQAARIIGSPNSTVNTWELCIKPPSYRYLPAIINFLGFVPWPCTPYQPTLGQAIQTAREINGYNQQQLADLAKTRKATIYKLENGLSKSKDIIKQVEKVLNTTFQRYLALMLLLIPVRAIHHPTLRPFGSMIMG